MREGLERRNGMGCDERRKGGRKARLGVTVRWGGELNWMYEVWVH